MNEASKTHSRALVIDDSATARASIGSVLKRARWEVHELPSAIGATRLILRHDIDVVIVDISMPGLSGDKLVSVLRSNPKLTGLVIIVVSGLAPVELRAIRERIPADAVLSKDEVDAFLLSSVLQARALRRSAS